MRGGFRKLLGITLVAPGVLVLATWTQSTRGDEPGSRLGRLFRLGGNSAPAPAPRAPVAPLGSSTPSLLPPPTSAASSTLAPGDAPPIRPVPRNSRPVTESDPLLTRVALGRADNGGQFCDFLQIYADGTVLDGSGVHHVGRDALKPILQALTEGDAFRIHGHCGGPPADYIEQVHMVVYERSLGRLRANSFSFSGNTQGCDHTIKHLQSAIEALQLKISGAPTLSPAAAPADAPALSAPAATTAPPSSNARPIPLTPLN